MSNYFKYFVVIIMVLVFTFNFSDAIAQGSNTSEVNLNLSIPPIALIDFEVEGNQTITYGYSYMGLNNVEQMITPTTADNTWINYSSIVNDGSTNYITVHLSSGSLPADVLLKLIVGGDVGQGAGNVGTPVSGEIIVTTYPQVIISNIGNCYTGAGVDKGHQLTYIWENPQSYNYSLNYQNGQMIAVTYTISSTE